ncbi:MAG: hypothetical protein M0Z65_15945 [Firmicutes bacterium]|uniref:MYXO-CTERM domain-containing protein n=1 Tax=Melghirimyces thermohalophilus TaxID=1236220 RepID=A0A1G6K6T8_9BACL|nr:hypothetical protein [Melghirimyces thermohalophilus]MDA8354644.1 hypothetical protein [Bacillota bacterium]SDC26026.1 MYXO-CTERM domain-containing protein [Melghirimyces thermohalophilus]
MNRWIGRWVLIAGVILTVSLAQMTVEPIPVTAEVNDRTPVEGGSHYPNVGSYDRYQPTAAADTGDSSWLGVAGLLGLLGLRRRRTARD